MTVLTRDPLIFGMVIEHQVPLLAGSSQASGMRRGQALLNALASFGLPVRGEHRKRSLWARPANSQDAETNGPRRSPVGCSDSRSIPNGAPRLIRGAPSRPAGTRRVNTVACHYQNLSSARASTGKSG